MSAPGARRIYGGVTGEARVAERHRKLIDAGINLFGSGDSGQIRVKDVVAAAGLTERYFYESFSDLAAFFDAVLNLTIAAIERDVLAAVADAPDDGLARVSIAVRTTVDKLVADPRSIRIIFIEGFGRGGRACPRRNEILVRASENFFEWSTASGSSFDAGPADARMKAFAMSGAASELLISWAEGLLEITPAELADFLVGLYRRLHLS